MIAILLVASQSAASELTLVEKIAAPDSRISGLAWDSDHLWISFEDNASVYQGMIVKMDMSGNIVGSFYAPGSDGIYDVPDAAGLAFDGTCLWSLNSRDHVIYPADAKRAGHRFHSRTRPLLLQPDMGWRKFVGDQYRQ